MRISTLLAPSVKQISRKTSSRCFTSKVSESNLPKTGAGFGNVRDRVFPTCRKTGSRLYKHSQTPITCSIVGAPMTYGQPFVGTDTGPALLREAGLRNMLSALGWRVEDLPDLDMDSTANDEHPGVIDSDIHAPYSAGNAKNCRLVGQGCKKVSNLVEEKLREGRFPLVLGGDHSIGIGSLSGILRVRPETGVLWVDAHADLNTPEISESGNMHGMPVGLLMDGMSTPVESLPGFEWLRENKPRLRPDSLVYVGLRDVDPAERSLIQSLGILAYTMHDIDHYGIGRVMEMALQHLLAKNSNRPLHLSYDIDSIDPVLAPATGTTVRGGLTFREAHYVAEAAALSGNLISAEIVELNPSLSDDQGAKATIELGLQIITSLMGKSII